MKTKWYIICSIIAAAGVLFANACVEGNDNKSGNQEKVAAPTGIVAIVEGNKVNIEWNAVPQVTRYRVYRNTQRIGVYKKIIEIGAFTAVDTAPKDSNYYKVCGLKDEVEGVFGQAQGNCEQGLVLLSGLCE